MAVTPPAAGMPCRRCNQVPAVGAVIIYGPDEKGALVARQAQCRGRCRRKAPARQDTPSRAVTMTASRLGRCAGCERDVIPGDVLARATGQSFHYECAPPEHSRDWTWRRDRELARHP
jgi:hypothetical protein